MLANVPGIVPIPKRTGHGREHGAKRTLIKSELASAYGDRQIGSVTTPDTGESIGRILSQQRCAPAPDPASAAKPPPPEPTPPHRAGRVRPGRRFSFVREAG